MPDANEADKKKAGEADVAAIVKTALDAVDAKYAKQFETQAAQIADLGKNLSVVADTLKNAPPAKDDKAASDGKAAKDGDGTKPEALTPEAVSKLVADGIAAHDKARADDVSTRQAREQIIAKVAKEKLGGDADLAKLLSGDDEAALTASADALSAKIKTYKPDFGGAAKDGGDVPGATGAAKTTNHNLSPGTAAFADSIKLPA